MYIHTARHNAGEDGSEPQVFLSEGEESQQPMWGIDTSHVGATALSG
jgi:hypothetical protein